jgi:predicted metal-dependent phosphoesterase TrpH
MKTDLHFHSKLSDGRITSREIIEIALKKKAEFIACTEHDIINVDFPILAKEQGIESLE